MTDKYQCPTCKKIYEFNEGHPAYLWCPSCYDPNAYKEHIELRKLRDPSTSIDWSEDMDEAREGVGNGS